MFIYVVVKILTALSFNKCVVVFQSTGKILIRSSPGALRKDKSCSADKSFLIGGSAKRMWRICGQSRFISFKSFNHNFACGQSCFLSFKSSYYNFACGQSHFISFKSSNYNFAFEGGEDLWKRGSVVNPVFYL